MARNTKPSPTSALERRGLPSTIDVESEPDTTSPVLRSFSFSQRTVDTRESKRLLWVEASATDSEAGVRRIGVRMEGYPTVVLDKVPTTESTYRGWLTVRQYSAGTVRVRDVVVTDGIGNRDVVTFRELGAAGWPNLLTVLSQQDRTVPQLTSFSLDPDTLDVRSANGEVTVTAEAHDTGAGVGGITVYLSGEGAFKGVNLHLASGTASVGTWTGILRLDRCKAVDGPWRVTMFVTDRAFNEHRYRHGQLRDLAFDSKVDVEANDVRQPFPWRVYHSERTGNVVVRFNEPVTGIDSDSLPLRPSGSEHRRDWLDGSWACVDTQKLPSDCSTGEVFRAVFTPLEPQLEAAELVMLTNPEHVLSLTDLSGNPAEPRASYGFD
jgi:hypothetical protein